MKCSTCNLAVRQNGQQDWNFGNPHNGASHQVENPQNSAVPVHAEKLRRNLYGKSNSAIKFNFNSLLGCGFSEAGLQVNLVIFCDYDTSNIIIHVHILHVLRKVPF